LLATFGIVDFNFDFTNYQASERPEAKAMSRKVRDLFCDLNPEGHRAQTPNSLSTVKPERRSTTQEFAAWLRR